MNKKTLAAVIAVIIATSIGTGLGYQTFYELSNVDASIRDSNVHIDNSNVTLGENVTITNPPKTGPATPGTPTSEELPEKLPYDNVTYTWHLKTEYINNMTWMDGAFRYYSSRDGYNMSQTWEENYFRFLSQQPWFPYPIIMAPPSDVFITAEFNAETGWTKVVYQYKEPSGTTEDREGDPWSHYMVENWLRDYNVTVNGYTKTLT